MLERFWQWLHDTFFSGQEIELDKLAGQLCLAFLLGLAVGGIYWLTRLPPVSAGNGKADERSVNSFIATLVLLSILLAMVTQVIGENLARAFGLVGALSIVRFRTVVEDTRDTAFVIFAVVIGMAVGARQAQIALIGLPIGAVAALVTRPRALYVSDAAPHWNLTVRIGVGHGGGNRLDDTFREHLDDVQLLGTATGRQGAALDLTYRVRVRSASTPTAFVAALNGLEGVQSVELHRV